MALSKAVATEIVNAVRTDAECRRRINSVLRVLPDGAGFAGPIRNWAITWGMLGRTFNGVVMGNEKLKKADLSDWRYAQYACSGIADAAVGAINGVVIAGIKAVSREDREIADRHHSAVLVEMKDRGEYIFDWWYTLNVDNPLIFHKKYWTTIEHLNAMSHTYRNFDPSLYDLK